MAQNCQILIRCPHYQRLIPGRYECNDGGEYQLAPDGAFLLHLTDCSHNGGRCAETLCALHRYNRGGKGTWFPSTLIPPPQQDTPAGAAREAPQAPTSASWSDGSFDLRC